MSAIRIDVDRSDWPLVKVRFPREPITDLALRRYLAEISTIGGEGRAYALLTDLRAVRAPWTAAQRLIFDEWMRRNAEPLDRVAVGNAIVADTSLSRSITETAYWNWRDPALFRMFRKPQAAQNWCRSRIHRLAAGRRRRRVRTTPPPQEIYASAAIIDMFTEPAFLLATSGEVVFANRAAREVFPPPRPWLRDAVSMAAEQCDMPMRIAGVSIDGRDLHLVVLGEGAAFAGLPPRLLDIARLISQGKTDKEIAQSTGLAETSVRTYVRRLYARAGVTRRAELVRMWFLRPRG